MAEIGNHSIKIVQLSGGAGSGSWSVVTALNGDRTYTDSISGTTFTVPLPLISRSLVDLDGNTSIKLESGLGVDGGDIIKFQVDGVDVGSVEVIGGVTKWTLNGILDPIAYQGKELTIAQRNALTPLAGYLVYISDGAIKEYQYYNGTTWKTVGATINDTLTSTSTTEALSAQQGKVLQDTKVNKPTLLTDAGKMLIVNAAGTDVEYAVVDADEVIESTIALTGAAPVGAKYGINTVTGLTYYVSGGNWVASPVSTVDLSTTISDETGVNGTGLLVPSTPPAGTPDIGDLHIEIYDDVKIYFTSTANDWLTPTVVETQIDQRTSIFAWGANTSYTVGDLVTAESRTYRRLTNGTSAATFALDRANWEVIVPLQAISPWSAATYYYEGETLNVNSRVFRCNTSHTSNGGNFGVDELTNWDRVDNISSSLDYQGSFYYYQGEQITNNKKIYRRVTAGTSGLLFDVTEQANWAIVGGGVATNIPNSPDSTLAPVFISNRPIGGNIGLPTTTVDINSVFSVTQTTSGQTLTLPNPTVTTGARLVTIQNSLTSTTSFTVYGQELQIGNSIDLLWDGSAWSKIGVDATTESLTYGRVRANLDLASTTHINTDPGTKIPFTISTYLSGMTDNAGSLIPSVTGRYRADWLCMAASTDFLADGIFHVVQNGVSVGQVSYNMNEASAVNQSAGFIDVNLVAGQEVSLHYRTRHTASDGIAWDRGSYFQLTQLPTAVAPVVDTVAEYGENNGITDNQSVTSTLADIAGSSFTLPSAGVWEVDYIVYSNLTSGTAVLNLNVLMSDTSNNLVPNSNSYNSYDASSTVSGGVNSQKVFITTTAATTYKLRAITTAITATINNSNVTGAGTGTSKITWNKIAGQLPSTGSTVDKVYARQTTTQGAPTVGTIINLEQVVSGNIPFSSNTVTLEAGKTYLLEGTGAIMAGGSSTYGTRFYNVTTSQFIGDSSFAFSPNNANTPTLVARTAMVEITPTVTTQVQLRVDFLSGSGGIIGGSNLVNAGVGAGSNFDPNGASWMRVTQLGTTSNTVGTLPAVDQSSAGYFTVGNLKYMWGTGNTNGLSTVTLPTAFSTTNYSVITSYVGGNTIVVNPTNTKTTTTFQVNSFFAPDGGPSGSASFDYIAIGQ